MKTKTGFVQVIQKKDDKATDHVFENASAYYNENTGVLSIRNGDDLVIGIYPNGEVFRVVVHDDDPRKGAAS